MRCARLLLPALILAAAVNAGCQQNTKPSKEEGAEHWNAARATVLLNLAKEQYQDGNFDKCRQTIADALKFNAQNAELRVLSGRLYIEAGELESAELELQRARQQDPKNPEADYLSGVVYQRWQKPDIAYECYSAACRKAPAELSYLLAQAEMLVALDRVPEALAILQDKVAYFEHSPVIRDAIGMLLVQEGRYGEACDVYRQAILLAGDDSTIHEHMALALFYAKRYNECITTITRLLQDPDNATRSDLMLMSAECQFALGHYREARQEFEEASTHDSASPHIWLGLAKSAMELNDTRRVELSIKKVLALDATSVEAHLLLGYLRLRQNRLDDALVEFLNVNSRDHGDTLSLCMIGYVLEKQGHGEEALRYYGRALSVKPGDELATRLMAAANPHE